MFAARSPLRARSGATDLTGLELFGADGKKARLQATATAADRLSGPRAAFVRGRLAGPFWRSR